jgi:hypothetical protein
MDSIEQRDAKAFQRFKDSKKLLISGRPFRKSLGARIRSKLLGGVLLVSSVGLVITQSVENHIAANGTYGEKIELATDSVVAKVKTLSDEIELHLKQKNYVAARSSISELEHSGEQLRDEDTITIAHMITKESMVLEADNCLKQGNFSKALTLGLDLAKIAKETGDTFSEKMAENIIMNAKARLEALKGTYETQYLDTTKTFIVTPEHVSRLNK